LEGRAGGGAREKEVEDTSQVELARSCGTFISIRSLPLVSRPIIPQLTEKEEKEEEEEEEENRGNTRNPPQGMNISTQKNSQMIKLLLR